MGLFFKRKKKKKRKEKTERYDMQLHRLAYVLVFSDTRAANELSTDRQIALATEKAEELFDYDGFVKDERELKRFLKKFDPQEKNWRKACNRYRI